MNNKSAAGPQQTWPPWAIWLPCLLAFAASGALLFTDLVAQVMGSWDTPAPGLGWFRAAAAGHCALAAADAGLLAAGVTRPGWRRPAAITAWMIIPAGIGLLMLARSQVSRG
jgi:hypothetical protein